MRSRCWACLFSWRCWPSWARSVIRPCCIGEGVGAGASAQTAVLAIALPTAAHAAQRDKEVVRRFMENSFHKFCTHPMAVHRGVLCRMHVRRMCRCVVLV